MQIRNRGDPHGNAIKSGGQNSLERGTQPCSIMPRSQFVCHVTMFDSMRSESCFFFATVFSVRSVRERLIPDPCWKNSNRSTTAGRSAYKPTESHSRRKRICAARWFPGSRYKRLGPEFFEKSVFMKSLRFFHAALIGFSFSAPKTSLRRCSNPRGWKRGAHEQGALLCTPSWPIVDTGDEEGLQLCSLREFVRTGKRRIGKY